MPITRIFRVRIYPHLRAEFERKFASVSVAAVRKAPGLEDVSILMPTQWAPDEYSMISTWRDEGAVKAFAGESWSEAFIPAGMEKYVTECWVHHYLSWNEA
jgi:heme oxygenase (mycobilin-producing)